MSRSHDVGSGGGQTIPARSDWQPLVDLPPLVMSPQVMSTTARVAAVDLGSSRIRVSLCDFAAGRRLGAMVGANPQLTEGVDVLTRLAAAREPEAAARLAELAVKAIGEGLAEARVQAGGDTPRVERLAIVGNTAMLSLLSRRGSQDLLQPEHWGRPIDCRPVETGAWRKCWGLADVAELVVVEPLGGFVGSDLLAAALACGLTGGPPGSLLIDFGTNTEIALWDGETVLVTAAAGGPAFEVWGASGHRASTTVGLIADLRRRGELDRLGRRRAGGERHPHPSCAQVDGFVRAKAAVAAGVEYVLVRSGMTGPGLVRTIVTGAFGHDLDVNDAREIGLVPAGGAVELRQDLALLGCEMMAAGTPVAVEGLREVRRRARLINLAIAPEYEDLFVHNLKLQPSD